jgi:hypothetical protein
VTADDTPASRRRRSGFLLAAFGAVGLLLTVTSLAFVLAPMDAEEGPLGLEGQRRQIVAFLDASSAAIADAETTAREADESLESTSSAAGSAGTFMNQLAGTMRTLSASLRTDLFGSQPFAGPADEFLRVADQASLVATNLEAAAASVNVAGDDVGALAGALGTLRDEMAGVRERLSGRIEADPWRILVAAFLVWLAIPAAVCLALGIRWIRPDWRRPRRALPDG